MLIFKYPWWAFALAAVLAFNPYAFAGFVSTLILLTLLWPYKDASHTLFVLSFGGFQLALLLLITSLKVATNG